MSRTRSGWVTLAAILFLLVGVFNLIIGLFGLGVSFGGGSEIETTTRGDWPTDNLEGISIGLVVLGGLLIFTGGGIIARNRSAWVLGLIFATASVIAQVTYHRLLDGWAWIQLALAVGVLLILALKEKEFH